MSDPNIYQGAGAGGVDVAKVNVVPYGVDNTGLTDCGPALNSIFAALVSVAFAAQQAAWIPAGSYTIHTPVVVPSGLIVWCESGAKITSTVPGASFFDAAFYAEATNFGTVASTTIAAGGAPKGGRTLNVAASAGFAKGQSIIVEQAVTSGLVAQQFTVEAVGVGTITTDDTIEFTFSPGDTVQTFNPPTGIYLYGNGASITASGGGGPLFEMQSCQRSIVKDFNISATVLTSYAGSWDTASRDCQWERMHVIDGGGTQATLAIESGNRVKAIDCTTFNSLGPAFWYAGGANCEGRGCAASFTTGNGFSAVPTVVGDVDGARALKLVDCTAENCTIAGVGQTFGRDIEITGLRSEFNVYGIFLNGITGAMLSNIDVSDNTGDGIVFEQSGGVSCTQIVGSSIIARGCGTAGIFVDTGNHYVSLSDVTLSDQPTGISVQGTSQLSFANVSTDRCATGIDIVAAATLLISNFRAEDCGLTGGACIHTSAASDVTIEGGRWRKTQNSVGNWFGVNSVAAGAKWQIEDVVIEKVGAVAGTMFALVDNAGGGATLRVRNVRTVGSLDFGIFVAAAAGSVWRLGDGNNFASVTAGGGTAITPGAGQFNRGTVIANGVNAVAVAFTDIQPAGVDTVKLTSTGPTPTAYLFSQTAGTGFSIKATAGDANTYDYEIS